MAAGWRVEETRALVSLWGQANVQSELDIVVRNRTIYERIAREMRALGYDRMWQQCRTKIKNLTQKYRKVSICRLLHLSELYRCLFDLLSLHFKGKRR